MKSIFYKIGFNTSIQIFGKIITTILSFISVGILTRYLGHEGYGNFTLTIAYLSFFGLIADLGLQLTMIRELAKKNLPKEIYGTYFWLKFLLVAISTVLAIIVLLVFPYQHFLKIGIIIAAVGVALGLLNNFGIVIFQANIRLDLVTIVDVFVKLVTTIFITLFVYWKFNFYSIINTILLGNLAGSVLIIFWLRKFIGFNFKPDLKLAKKLIIKSLPVGLVSIVTLFYFKIDTLILSLFRSTSEVGIYGLAYGIFENLLVVWGFYMASVYPLLSGYWGSGKNVAAKNLFRKSVNVAIYLSLPIVFLGYILSPLVIDILGGKEFVGSIIALRILLFSVPLFFINNLFYHSFLAREKIKPLLIAIILSLAINITLNVIFIPKFGYPVAALNTLLTEFCLFVLYFLSFSKIRFL